VGGLRGESGPDESVPNGKFTEAAAQQGVWPRIEYEILKLDRLEELQTAYRHTQAQGKGVSIALALFIGERMRALTCCEPS
jgi:hypothetical protein